VIDDVLNESKQKMQACINALKDDLAVIRTGRATPALVEKLHVEYYGQPTQLMQLASISVPEPRQLLIRPFDPASLKDIEKAIQTSDLGLTPGNDGKAIRLTLPQPTEERRKELVKTVHARMEEARVTIRAVRRDGNKDLRDFEEEKLISKDDLERAENDVQKLHDEFIDEINSIGERKEQEVMEI
jgi:ribosome recycling factor